MEYTAGRKLGLDKQEAAVFEWQFRFIGGFGKALFEAIIRADDRHLEDLAKGFPDEVEGYRKYTRVDGWWTKVREKANKAGGEARFY